MDNRYVIEEKMLLRLIASYYKLQALESYGVDNWSWYNESLNNFLSEVAPKYIDENEYWDYGYEELAEDMINIFVEKELN